MPILFDSKSKLFFFVLFVLTSDASIRKLLSKDVMQQYVGSFLKPDSAQKMRETSKQWSNVKIYENIFPSEIGAVALRCVKTGEILWETIRFPKFWRPIPEQKELISHLLRKDSEKWDDVFVCLVKNWFYQYRTESKGVAFLKKLMPEIAKIIPLNVAPWRYFYPLRLAEAWDDTDSILTLINRGADINQKNCFGRTVLHYAAHKEKMSMCAFLINNNANINSLDSGKESPLMFAATSNENKNLFEFLIEKGADQTLKNYDNKTALQLSRFEKKESTPTGNEDDTGMQMSEFKIPQKIPQQKSINLFSFSIDVIVFIFVYYIIFLWISSSF